MKPEHSDLVTAKTPQQLKEIVAEILEKAQGCGVSAAEVSASVSQNLSVSVRMGDIDILERGSDQGMDLTVYLGKRSGSSAATGLTHADIAKLVEEAVNIAKYTGEDDYAGLADADDMATEIPDLQLHHPWTIDTASAIELATECEDTARAEPLIVNSEGAQLSTIQGTYCYGNTHGFNAAYRGTRHSILCSVVAGKNGAMQRDMWFDSNRNAETLQSAKTIGRRAAERAVQRLGASKVQSCKIPVLFVPETAASLIGHFTAAISGSALYKGTSFLPDSLNKAIFPAFVQLSEQPRLPCGLYSAPFDGEGVATRDQIIVADGVVQNYILNSYAARRLSMKTTANDGGLRNVILSGEQKSFDELLKDMDKGLVVTELIGMGVNPVTGDYSRGASGFWVENGKIDHPVEEITIAGNLSAMYSNIVALGNDIDQRYNIRCGSILIGEMAISGM